MSGVCASLRRQTQLVTTSDHHTPLKSRRAPKSPTRVEDALLHHEPVHEFKPLLETVFGYRVERPM